MQGDSDRTFRTVFDRAFPLAERLARRITGDDVASEDIAAEALTRLYARWWRMASADHLDAWVLRVATNLSIDHVRRRRPVQLEAGNVAADLDDSVVLRMALANALGHLPRRQREVVALRYLSDLSEADVAAVLGVTTGSVKTHLHRGLAQLRSALKAADETEVEVRLAGE
jgi:RNA polymerase sigma-70 factor (sigma-E family)